MDDRFEDIKKLLDSTIDEFQSLFESAGGFEDSRVGNGWNPEKITPDIYYLAPKSLEELRQTAEARKRSLFQHRFFSFLKPRESEVRLVGEPKLRLVPFWRVKAYHECFFFRGNSYRIELPEDVVAVEVEGKIRDLVGQETTESQLLRVPLRRLLGRRDLSGGKSIRLNDVTELAYVYKDGSLFLDADGRENLEAEAFFDKKVPLQKLSKDEVATWFQEAEIGRSSISKEDMVRKLHETIVKPPESFSRILSNRFQVTELAQYFMPVYTFTFESKGQRRSLVVHGYTGGVFQ